MFSRPPSLATTLVSRESTLPVRATFLRERLVLFPKLIAITWRQKLAGLAAALARGFGLPKNSLQNARPWQR